MMPPPIPPQGRRLPVMGKAMEYLSYGGPAAAGFAGPAGMAGRAAGVGFAAFLQKYPLVGRLFGR